MKRYVIPYVTDYGGGWWCFVISIIWIGILTGIITDLASSFGCTIRLKDSVTAITFVALGTSVPGKLINIFMELYLPSENNYIAVKQSESLTYLFCALVESLQFLVNCYSN